MARSSHAAARKHRGATLELGKKQLAKNPQKQREN
jgi:hypothetical protein